MMVYSEWKTVQVLHTLDMRKDNTLHTWVVHHLCVHVCVRTHACVCVCVCARAR